VTPLADVIMALSCTPARQWKNECASRTMFGRRFRLSTVRCNA